jgi:hypothetical protein
VICKAAKLEIKIEKLRNITLSLVFSRRWSGLDQNRNGLGWTEKLKVIQCFACQKILVLFVARGQQIFCSFCRVKIFGSLATSS